MSLGGKFCLFLCLGMLFPGCATMSGLPYGAEDRENDAERVRQENKVLEEEIEMLELKEGRMKTEVQNLKLELSELKGNESVLYNEIERLKDGKAELEERLLSSRGHQKRLEGELAESDERLSGLIKKRKGDLAELDKIKSEVSSELRTYGGVSVEVRSDAAVIILENVLTLRTGKVSIRKEALPLMEGLVKVLKKYPAHKLEINGHTDDVPIKVSYPDNRELSVARALAVLHYLEDKGIDPARMSAAGYGEYMPRATNTTPEGRVKNRRVEVLVLR